MSPVELRAVIEAELGQLIRIFEKLLRASFNTGPTAPIVRGWVLENADACINVATAYAESQGISFDAMADAAIEHNNADWIIDLVGNAAFAAAKESKQ